MAGSVSSVCLLAAMFTLSSPDGKLNVAFENDESGMRWSLQRGGATLVEPSPLGLVFAKSSAASVQELAPMKVIAENRASRDATFKTPIYRRGEIRDRYNELEVALEETEAHEPTVGMGRTVIEKAPRRITLVFRAYDEGVAFRYLIPEQKCFDGFELEREKTEWRFPGDPEVIATEYKYLENGQEEHFRKKRLSEIPEKSFVGSPLIVDAGANGKAALFEAALSDWAGMYFRRSRDSVQTYLTPLPRTEAATSNAAVIRRTPAASPWRVTLVGDDELDLLKKNDILLALNPPPDESIDFSFVKPGASSWDWWTESNNSLSTELTLKLVDFAAEMGWPYHTIDGGWYGFARKPNHGPDVEMKPRKDFNLKRIVEHAKEKGVGIWVWIHWMEIDDTGIEETFRRLEEWGVKGVKTDFLNRQDQWIVNWYERVLRAAARHRIMVNFHGAFKPSGTERTWPNNLTREGVLGNEFNLFRSDVTPEHCLALPFTRFLLGPGDFTPGGFGNVYSKDFVPQVKKGHRYGDETDRCPYWAEQQGTRAFALAQCAAYDSYLMTMCDWPERYRGAAGVEAIRSLPTVWNRTLPLAGRFGEYYVVAREAKDGRWYLAAMTVAKRNLEVKLDFLGPGAWRAKLFCDDPERTPRDAKALAVSTRQVSATEIMPLHLCAEGGALVVFEQDSSMK